MKTAVLLARVSTPEQEKAGLSIEEIQVPKMREYASKNNLHISKEFIFQETASAKLRKKFQAMIDYVLENNIKSILALRVDRLTRNFRDYVLINDLMDQHGIEVHFVEEHMVVDKDSVGNVVQNWDMKVFMAKQHVNICRAHQKDNYENKLKSGKPYTKVPYGYRNIRVGKEGSVEVNEFEKNIVKLVFNMYTTDNHSYSEIAKHINKNYPEQKFHKTKVERVLKNPYYYGYQLSKGKLYPHPYETFVTKDIYDIAVDLREGRTKSTKKISKHQQKGIFGGLIRCECGCAMTGQVNRHFKEGKEGVKSEYYYYCSNGKDSHEVGQKPKGTNDHDLNLIFASIFKDIQVPENELEGIISALKDSHKGKIEFNEQERDICNTQIATRQNRIEQAYTDKLDGSITQQQYDKFYNKWTDEISQYEDRLNLVSKADKEYYITAGYLLELASRSYELFLGSKPEQKRKLINLTLQNLVWIDGELQYEWKKPFSSIANCKERHEWGHLCDQLINCNIDFSFNDENILVLLNA